MTTNEHLQAIKAKCQRMIELAESEPHSFMDSGVAAYKSTIAAIGAWEMMDGGAARQFLANDILDAWPLELLQTK